MVAATLAQVLVQDPDPQVRAKAASVLGKVQGPQAVAALDQALEDPDHTVRRQAVQAYARAQRPDLSTQALSIILAYDPDPSVRRQAAASLGTLRTDEAKRALTAATPDADPMVQRAVSSALAKWQTPSALRK